MERFHNLTMLLAIDHAVSSCFSALSPSIQQNLLSHNTQLHTREDFLLYTMKLLLPDLTL